MRKNKLLLLLVLLMTAATGAWGKQIYISYPAWPTGTSSVSAGNLVLEMELSDSFENLKAKIEDKSGLNPTYMHLFFNDAECPNDETLAQKGVTEGSVLTLEYTPPYAVKLADGTADAGNWTATVGTNSTAQSLPLTGLEPGTAVTVKYNGRLKVKGVKATSDEKPAAGKTVELSTLEADYEAQNGDVLTGVTTSYKVTIAAGATVTLDGVNISSDYSYCIKCAGEATIILKDGSTNTLTGTGNSYPALSIGDANTTLTIQGSTGVLNVTSGNYCAGIGGGYSNTNSTCGNIRIEGGVITAQGGDYAAGIGTDACPVTCGDIIITGGTITAKGGIYAAGIGTGNGDGDYPAVCGAITIANTVTKVTATKGADAPYSIGKGFGDNASCGTIIIGCTLDTNGNPVGGTKYWENNAAVDNDAATYLAQATIVYPKWDGDLSKLTAESTAEFATATDGMTIKGTLAANVKVSIAAGATVTLDGVTIVGDDDENYKWAGLNCLGNATIILKDRTQNRVQGFHEDYPGIHVPAGSRLTITGGTLGNGMLTATSSGYGAGIGGGNIIHCGNIDIQGGYIAATGGIYAAGIGGGLDAICGNITISGGTVRAMGGPEAAGIGGGSNGRCGGIMITNGVTRVFAMKDDHSPYSIGAGNGGSCVTVAIGGTVYWQDNAAVNDGDEYLATNPLEYRPMPQP